MENQQVPAPLVSVVIPCYNHEEYVRETVASVLKSDFDQIEVVIVDDGSLDKSIQVIEELSRADSRIQYIKQQNAGPSAARNRAIEKASGTYILPLDADDLISPEYISAAVKILEQQTDVRVVYCQAEKFGDKKGPWRLKKYSPYLLARDNMIFVSAVFRKSDWEACGGYSEDIRWGWEDWEFWIKMLKTGGEVVCLPLTGFYYRIRSGSRRKSMDKARKREMIDYLNHKHSHFIRRQLEGPLHYQRTHSRTYNRLLKFFGRSV